jgi:dCTP deaminase
LLLSDVRILEEMEKGNIVIEPFNDAQLSTNSYDVRLGNYFFVPNPHLVKMRRPVDFAREEDTRQFWGDPVYVPDTIVIDPGETFLAHTFERIGGLNTVTTSMRARSSMGRCGLSVCSDAGVGDVGYADIWTVEIRNDNSVPQVLHPGMRIAQIEFYEIGPTRATYEGKYGRKGTEWSVWDMIPKLWLDRDNRDGSYTHNLGEPAPR